MEKLAESSKPHGYDTWHTTPEGTQITHYGRELVEKIAPTIARFLASPNAFEKLGLKQEEAAEFRRCIKEKSEENLRRAAELLFNIISRLPKERFKKQGEYSYTRHLKVTHKIGLVEKTPKKEGVGGQLEDYKDLKKRLDEFPRMEERGIAPVVEDRDRAPGYGPRYSTKNLHGEPTIFRLPKVYAQTRDGKTLLEKIEGNPVTEAADYGRIIWPIMSVIMSNNTLWQPLEGNAITRMLVHRGKTVREITFIDPHHMLRDL